MTDLILNEIEKGTEILAVTDHFDVCWVNDKDIFTCVIESNREAEELNKIYGDRIKILKGIEISEAIWDIETYEKAMKMSDYDVVIGSVHCVRYGEYSAPYAQLDFSVLSRQQLEGFMDAYFADMAEMLRLIDFDILAHLTCPLRYIIGKYNLPFDISRYSAEIDGILKTVIERGIALEVNTSSFDTLGDFMPTKQIIKRYYELGGRMVTLGSDAHIARRASHKFDEAVSFLKETGFGGIYTFIGRKPNLLKF
jgi:histidinol-phosphatase (PHP family)